MSMCSNIFWPCLAWRSVFMLLSALSFSHAFLMDSKSASSTAFHLTYQPGNITKDLTEHVKLRCAHAGDRNSQLQTVTAISIKKKETSGWRLMAETRNSGPPEALAGGISVSGKIVQDTKATFLEITWPVATDDTFGVFLCEVTGKNSNGWNTVEPTALVKISENGRNDKASDILVLEQSRESKLLARLDRTVAEQSKRIDNLDTALASINTSMVSINEKLNSRIDKKPGNGQSLTDLASLSLFVKSLDKTVTAVSEDVARLKESKGDLSGESLRRWPTGNYALLQPKTGCPRDIAFLGRPESYLRLHTEGTDNRDGHSAVLAPGTSVTMLGLNLMTVRFCEANGVSSTAKWPLGSYCINKLFDNQCPGGFNEGFVHLDSEDSANFDDYAGNVVRILKTTKNPSIFFCCTASGSSSSPIVLPTRSSFVLYRRGGVCQQVLGMALSEELVAFDTEDESNLDFSVGSTPDVFIKEGASTIFHLCHYTPKN